MNNVRYQSTTKNNHGDSQSQHFFMFSSFYLSDKMAPGDGARVPLDYDEVLEYIGQFGTFQKKIFFWLSFISAAAGLAVVVFAFTGKIIY